MTPDRSESPGHPEMILQVWGVGAGETPRRGPPFPCLLRRATGQAACDIPPCSGQLPDTHPMLPLPILAGPRSPRRVHTMGLSG